MNEEILNVLAEERGVIYTLQNSKPTRGSRI
jgi:hypothetical protein